MDQEIKKEFDDLAVIIKDSFGEMENKVAARFDDLESRMATKDDLKNLETRMDEKFGSLGSEIFQIQQELKDIKKSIEALAKRTLEDANVLAKDVLELRRRVDFLEKQIQKFQTAVV